jgi:hypothetical protein
MNAPTLEEFEKIVRADPQMVLLREAEAKFQKEWAEARAERSAKILALRARARRLDVARQKIYRIMQSLTAQAERMLKNQIPKPLNLRTCEKRINGRKRAIENILVRAAASRARIQAARAVRARPLPPTQTTPPNHEIEKTSKPETETPNHQAGSDAGLEDHKTAM